MIRVLIVDDDKLARKGLISLLPWSDNDMKVIGDVQNGRAALEFLEQQEADLVFVDIDMPEMTGLELIEICKERHPQLQFVILTFYEDFGYAQNAIRLGVLDYISKLKLDTEDCDSILARVRNIMMDLQSKEVSEENSMKAEKSGNDNEEVQLPELDADKWIDMTRRWEKGFWLYDDDVFQMLREETEKLGNVFRSMHPFVVWLTQSLETGMGWEAADRSFAEQINRVDSLEALWQWLIAWRGEMCRFAEQEVSLSRMPVCMLKTVLYVKEHINEPLHTEILAERIGMSRSYFSVNFKKLVGKTFHEYVKRERTKKAKLLLSTTDLSITEVAARSGYEDVNYFNKVFLEEVGCAPGLYRKQSK